MHPDHRGGGGGGGVHITPDYNDNVIVTLLMEFLHTSAGKSLGISSLTIE